MTNQLIEDNMPLVYHVVKKYYPTYTTDEDIVSNGMLGLCKAANSYDPEKGKFSAFACQCIIYEIRNEIRRRNKQPKLLSLEYEVENSMGDETTLMDYLVGEEDVSFVDVEGRLGSLKPRDREILKLYSTGLTQREIAKIFNVSPQTINTSVRKAKLLWRSYDEK